MNRRDFLAATSASLLGAKIASAAPVENEREKLLYVVALYAGTKINAPDYLATIDADPASPTYAKIIHRLPMPNVGDELHHFGWSACGSCDDPAARHKYMIVPGFQSSRIHVLDMANPREPKIHKVIEPEEVKKKANLSAPHTIHCLADGHIMISMLGDADGNGPGGFLLMSKNFEVLGRWETDSTGMKYNYDFWYQPRHNVMVSSEWSAPNTFKPGFKLEDVPAGKYGQQIHFWDWKARKIIQTINLGNEGLIPLEVRFHHNPDSAQGYVGAALSSTMWHWNKTAEGKWKADKVIVVEPAKDVPGWSFPVPGLITDLLISLDDRFLYFSNWLHGDIRQYDISDPAKPKLVGQVWLGGVIGKTPAIPGIGGGPQMIQLSKDGKRLYVTNSLFSSWDNMFYPKMASEGSWLIQVDCNTEAGGLKVNEKFVIDFGKEPQGPARAHEMRYPGGDCTSDISA
ncbi:MAG: selenium-binding family protein [Planctomycetia bacterium]|nr:selenium-binding family protein [Planctomycetia bacterium]